MNIRFSHASSTLVLQLLLCLALLAAQPYGCARTKLPKVEALSSSDRLDALARLEAFTLEPAPSSADIGYTLCWHILGQSGKVEAQLQMEGTDFLRFSVHDPLGRVLYLALADDKNFTLIDSRAARVQKGPVNGKTWRAKIPEPFVLRDIMPLVSGRITLTDAQKAAAFHNPEQSGFWFIWREGEIEQRIFLDKKQNHLERRLWVRGKDEILLDARYPLYSTDKRSGYLWPCKLELSGTLVKGMLSLERSGSISFDPLPLSAFHPAIPPHFKVEVLH